MSFVVLGLNHATAPIDLLEQVTIAPDELPKALHDLSMRPHISEAVVLSTCNRTEVYVEAERFHGAFQDVRDFLAEHGGARLDRVNDSLYTYYDDEAVEHLFRVSAGVDSAVLGEHEILGQVKRGWRVAQQEQAVGANLNAVFRAALEVGKRVRTDTSIARHVASVSQAAIVLAADRLSGLSGRHVLLIGAGEMGSGMALTLSGMDLASITITSRTTGTADELAARIGATVRPLDELEDALVDADVVFTSTAAPSLVIDAKQIADVAAARRGRPLTIIDVAMPRDVDPAASGIVGIQLCDLDAVGAFIAEGLEQRAGEIDDANRIISEEMSRFAELVGQQSVAPLITEFRARAEQIRVDELARQSSRLAALDNEQRQIVDDVTRSVLNKLLHDPTVQLKESSTSLRGERLAAAMRELFDLG